VAGEFRAAYRLQLTPDFGFREARALVPYLRGLGVSHLYLSPSFRAREGSTHGYDVTDPRRVSDALGGEDELRALAAAGLGVILDVVSNHMATIDENPFWADRELRKTFFDVDARTGFHRRFFDIGDLGGVRIEDEAVFETLHVKAFELVRAGVVGGLRIDHIDGLANPREYLQRLRRAGVDHVWVEKILEPGEELRDWPVEGTTGYEFLNDVMHLFLDPASESDFTSLYGELTGESRSFEELAFEAKLEQAAHTFEPELRRLHAELDVSNPSACAGVLSRLSHLRRAGPRSRRGRRPLRDRACGVVGHARADPAARRTRPRRLRDALPADDRSGDGQRRRGHGLLPLQPYGRAERGRR